MEHSELHWELDALEVAVSIEDWCAVVKIRDRIEALHRAATTGQEYRVAAVSFEFVGLIGTPFQVTEAALGQRARLVILP